MDLVIDFVTENYVWLIIVGIIILMAVVGYVADKTDFGRNKIEKQPKEKAKKEKVVKEKTKKEKVVEELPVIEQNTIETMNSVENVEQPISNEYQQEILPENNVNDNNVTDDNQVDQSLFEPLPSIDQVFNEQPAEQNNIEISSEPININLETEESKQNSEVEPDDDIWKF